MAIRNQTLRGEWGRAMWSEFNFEIRSLNGIQVERNGARDWEW